MRMRTDIEVAQLKLDTIARILYIATWIGQVKQRGGGDAVYTTVSRIFPLASHWEHAVLRVGGTKRVRDNRTIFWKGPPPSLQLISPPSTLKNWPAVRATYLSSLLLANLSLR